jgi:hypothetical protein
LVTSGKFKLIYTALTLALVDEFLKRYADLGLFSFHDQVGMNGSQKPSGDKGTSDPRKCVAYAVLVGIALLATGEAAANYRAAEPSLQRLNDGRVAVGNVHPENVPDGVPSLRSDDRDAAVCIKQTGYVGLSQHGSLLSAYDGMVVNSVELRCPARKGAEGQYRAKQERDGALGVCNEQVPPSKEKVCSVLTGNRERAAEMTAPVLTCIVGAGYCRHQYRVKTSNNQGDRQCPTGRAYALQLEDIYFMVDPRFLFKWTGDLTYPDQMAFTRLCGLRFFMKTDRRMFSAVFDGVTA